MLISNSNNTSQEINNGNHNNQAGRDINQTIHNYYPTKSIQFYEKDIQKVITFFAKEIDEIGIALDDFYCPGIEEKNRINNLSEEYFNYMKREHLCYFKKIKVFLQDAKNRKYLIMYQKTVSELQCKIMVNRCNFIKFEEVFEMLIDYVINKGDEELMENRDLLIIFLHFMYWNCDIGDKYDKTS